MIKVQTELDKELQMDLLGGLEEKAKGMALARMNKEELLEHCRKVAVMLLKVRGTISTDDVRRAVNLPPVGANQQNWIGSIFKDSRFEPTGEFVASTIKRNHGAVIRLWRLK